MTTTPVLGRLECRADHITLPLPHQCESTAATLSSLGQRCVAALTTQANCSVFVSAQFQPAASLFSVSLGGCPAFADALNRVVQQYSRGTVRQPIGCTASGILKVNVGCTEVVSVLNRAIESFQDGTFTECTLSTPTTTATTSEATTVTTTVSTTATTTATTTSLNGNFECAAFSGQSYITVARSKSCARQTGELGILAGVCGRALGSTIPSDAFGNFVTCIEIDGISFTVLRTVGDVTAWLNHAIAEAGFPGNAITDTLDTTIEGFLVSASGTSCDRGVARLNAAFDLFQSGGNLLRSVRSPPRQRPSPPQ